MAYSLCHASFTLRNPSVFHLVCTRIPTVAREQRTVRLFITFDKTFFSLSELREAEALETLAYYHANGNAYVYHIPSSAGNI